MAKNKGILALTLTIFNFCYCFYSNCPTSKVTGGCSLKEYPDMDARRKEQKYIKAITGNPAKTSASAGTGAHALKT